MADVPLAGMLADVRPEVVGCSNMMMNKAILDAAVLFCESAHIWEVALPAVTLSANTSEYPVVQPANQRVIRITQAISSTTGRMLKKVALQKMDAESGTWRNNTGANPIAWMMIAPRLMRFYPTPNATGEQITLRAIVKPSPAATVIDDSIYDDYHNGIAAKAKALLFAMPEQKWTNPNLVAYHESIFADAVSTARLAIANNHSNTNNRVQPVPFR